MQNSRTIWLIVLSAALFLGAAVVTLRAAEQATQPAKAGVPAAAAPGVTTAAPPGPGLAGTASAPTRVPLRPVAPATAPTRQHPAASAPEESATIADDPTTAPDPSQSADNNVSFPTDI